MMRKIHMKQAVVINLPTEDIFDYMSKLENMKHWSSAFISIQSTSPGITGVGATAKSTLRFLGNWSDVSFELVECEPVRCLTIKSTTAVAPFIFHYQFEHLENGGTHIAQDALISLLGAVNGRVEQVVTNAIRRDIERDLLTLKDMLETSASTYSSAARA